MKTFKVFFKSGNIIIVRADYLYYDTTLGYEFRNLKTSIPFLDWDRVECVMEVEM